MEESKFLPNHGIEAKHLCLSGAAVCGKMEAILLLIYEIEAHQDEIILNLNDEIILNLIAINAIGLK